MADPNSSRPGGREIGVWPIVIGAAIVIGLAVWFFMDIGVQEPVPLPDSPVATGTVGQPSGVTGAASDNVDGAAAEPGAPVGSEAPAGSPAVEPNPDLAPGTGVDTTRGTSD
ncbi:MAG TPA: hypothetical protein PLL33_02685 [Paracoccus sp. (in: a-proteobacteria)]|nr:hypothetical protein [Paracoccus sp. (in: a-proteobacteria)]